MRQDRSEQVRDTPRQRQNRTGELEIRQDRLNQTRTGKERTGQERSTSDRTEPNQNRDRTEANRTGQDKAVLQARQGDSRESA